MPCSIVMQPFQLVRLDPVRSADPPKNSGRSGAKGGDGVLRGFAGGNRVGHRRGLGDDGVGFDGEVGWQRAGDAAAEFGGLDGEGRGVGGELLLPSGLAGGAGCMGVPGGFDFLRDFERWVGPVEGGAGGRDFGGAERGAVGFVGAGLGRGAVPDDRLAADQRRAATRRHRLGRRGGNRLAVQAVDVGDDAPPVGFEARGGVVVEPAVDMAVDGDAVIVVEDDQLLQLHGPGEGAGLVRDALHQAAVAAEHDGAVIDDGVFAAVEGVGELLFRQGHADGGGDALPERAGGGLDAGGEAVFGVAGGLRMKLAETLQFVDRQVVAGEVQQPIQQHGAMAVRQHEAVAIRPGRIGGVVTHMMAPDDLGDVGHAHRHTGVAGVCLLHRVDREEAQGIRQQSGGGNRRGRVHHRLLR